MGIIKRKNKIKVLWIKEDGSAEWKKFEYEKTRDNNKNIVLKIKTPSGIKYVYPHNIYLRHKFIALKEKFVIIDENNTMTFEDPYLKKAEELDIISGLFKGLSKHDTITTLALIGTGIAMGLLIGIILGV